MKKLLFPTLIVASLTCNAIELLNYKNTSSNITKIDKATLETLWTSNTPACIKDGAKLLGVNKAFKSKRLGYRDCSSSDSALEKQKMLGYEVRVIKFTELPVDVAKQIAGVKN